MNGQPKGLWILVSGKRYAGKDTVADILKSIIGRHAERLSFAAAVKRECANGHKLDFEKLMTNTPYKEQHRQLLIDHGKRMREIDPDYWIKATVAGAIQTPATSHIVSDWRFPNEYTTLAALTDKHVIRIRVVASDESRRARGWVPSPVDADSSECSLDGYNDVITVANNGSPTELNDIVMRACIDNAKISSMMIRNMFPTTARADVISALFVQIVHKSTFRRQLHDLHNTSTVLLRHYTDRRIDYAHYAETQVVVHSRMQQLTSQIASVDTFIEQISKAVFGEIWYNSNRGHLTSIDEYLL